jgi:hypothetical protein
MNQAFNGLVTEAYVKLVPSAYGERLQAKIRQMVSAQPVEVSEERGDLVKGGRYYDTKVTYLSRSSRSYSIRHIRPWGRHTNYLFCLIDSSDRFTPHFFVLDKYRLNAFTLRAMAGTPRSNMDNHNVELSMTVRKNSPAMRKLEQYNLLESTSLESLVKWFDAL